MCLGVHDPKIGYIYSEGEKDKILEREKEQAEIGLGREVVVLVQQKHRKGPSMPLPVYAQSSMLHALCP